VVTFIKKFYYQSEYFTKQKPQNGIYNISIKTIDDKNNVIETIYKVDLTEALSISEKINIQLIVLSIKKEFLLKNLKIIIKKKALILMLLRKKKEKKTTPLDDKQRYNKKKTMN